MDTDFATPTLGVHKYYLCMWSLLHPTMLSTVAKRYLINPRTLGAASFCRRSLSLSPIHYQQDKLRVAIIGQSLFGLEVYKHLRTLGHEVAGVFTIPGELVL